MHTRTHLLNSLISLFSFFFAFFEKKINLTNEFCFFVFQNNISCGASKFGTCKGKKYIKTKSGLTRAEISAKLSLWRKLGVFSRLSLVQVLLKTNHVRAKAIITFKLSLFSKPRRVTVLELGWGATAGSNPEGCQGIEDSLCGEVYSDSPHARMETKVA